MSPQFPVRDKMVKAFYDYIFKLKRRDKMVANNVIKIAKIIAKDRLSQYGSEWEVLSDNVKEHYLEQALEVINIIQKENEIQLDNDRNTN